MQKDKMVREATEQFATDRVQRWYSSHLEGKNQGETINEVGRALARTELSISDALSIVFIVGLQWNVKFEGVP